jgi:hypothetical protein
MAPDGLFEDVVAVLSWSRRWLPTLFGRLTLSKVVLDAFGLTWRGGTGNCDNRRLSFMTSDQGKPAASWSVKFGSRSGEIGEGFGKPIDVAECDRLNLQSRSPVVSDRRFGLLKTWLKRCERDTA